MLFTVGDETRLNASVHIRFTEYVLSNFRPISKLPFYLKIWTKFQSYLENERFSSLAPLIYGVPQDLILAPLLSILYSIYSYWVPSFGYKAFPAKTSHSKIAQPPITAASS